MSLIFATQLTAVATVALAVLALAAAIVAGIALGKQSRQLAILAKQENRDIAERYKAQAARVYAAVEDKRPQYSRLLAENGSDFPVYDAQFWRPRPDGLTGPDNLGMIPANGRVTLGRPVYYEDLAKTVLTFRDAAGARWIRMPDGTLEEQTRDNAHDSILAALGRPLPGPAAPAPATGAAGQAEEPEAPPAQ
jgi:hypothetical protein